MNIQAHMAGQISGQVPNHSGMVQQNGNTHQAPQMGSMGGSVAAGGSGAGPPRNQGSGMNQELIAMRRNMQRRIYCLVQQRQGAPIDDAAMRKLVDVTKRLEEGLLKMATSKEDYMNLRTLEARLGIIIKQFSSHSQRHANSSSAVGTMIPTPGVSQGGNPNSTAITSTDASVMASSGCNSITMPVGGTGNVVPACGMHGGSLSSGYQQSRVNYSIGSGVSMESSGGQRMSSQMIPTPGFNNNINNNNCNSSQSYMVANHGGGVSAIDSAVLPQSQQQRQHIPNHNSLTLHGVGGQMGSSFRSGLQPQAYDMVNVPLNSGGVEIKGSDVKSMTEPRASDGSFNAPSYTNLVKSHQDPFEQLQQHGVHGNGFGMSSADSFGPGNFCAPATSAELMKRGLNMKSASLLPASGANSSFEHIQQQPQDVRPQQQFVYQHQKPDNCLHPQHLLNNDSYGQSQRGSNLFRQIKREPGTENLNEVLWSRQFRQCEPQNQFQQFPPAEDQFGAAPCASFSSESVMPGYRSQPNAWTPISRSSAERLQEDNCQRMPGPKEAQPNMLTEGSISGQNLAPRSTAGPLNPSNSTAAPNRTGDGNPDPRFRNQLRWLLFLRHARACTAPVGKCRERNCMTAQQLLRHMDTCQEPRCSYPRCFQSRQLINHFRECKNPRCPVCIPVKKYLHDQYKLLSRLKPESSLQTSASEVGKSYESAQASGRLGLKIPSDAEGFVGCQPSVKRMKVEQSAQYFGSQTESSVPAGSPTTEAGSSFDAPPKDLKQSDPGCSPVKVDALQLDKEAPPVQGNPGEMKQVMVEDVPAPTGWNSSVVKYDTATLPTTKNSKVEIENGPSKQESLPLSDENTEGVKSMKPKIQGVSLMELFTPDEIRVHIDSLHQWVGQGKAKVEKHQAMEHSMNENSCQLCHVEKLAFVPPPIYCIPCGARIKRNAMYYTVGAGDTRHYVCIPCYNESRGDRIVIEGTTIFKARFEKKKNDEETEEWWVQCDKCEAWQHQICALFNGRRNDGGQAEFTCPYCYIQEIERGERVPLPTSAVLGAKDLPRTILSDHIEERLFSRLRSERQERARKQGKSYDEVPGAEALVVRVVSSVDKKLDVKPRFLDVFREQNYAAEFPYKSKAILLFQKIEGVEVCLFGMYVQEFGSECAFPNQRRVYLSYLDSVKYFRPDVKTVNGEALRTFVYHEILIGYLEYCKKRGFTSCYIWACPPLKGEDYILYCHPEIQKTPKSDKLREWYLSMLRKATREKIVAECTNFYDHFFVQSGECRAKVTAARLPYFDGDYWPGAAEDLLYQISQEEDGKKLNKKGTTKKLISKRALKASGQTDLSANASKDLLLMHKLGETISPMKEDFIMVHLQYCCSHCCILMVSGKYWACEKCKNFQICDKCHEIEERREEREKHPINHKEKHTLIAKEITGVPEDTKDEDDILESEFFDTRQAFLSLCQGNHYQFDTLRRAKHSSMMVLYHLHNPTAPAFVTTCNVCHLDIETGQGWRCEVCPDYDVCNACYSKDGGINHPHKLTPHPSSASDAQSKEARQQRVLQLRKMLELLVHASQCRSIQCQYPNCRKVKGLFRHGMQCKVRASGGCLLCKRMWYLLQVHARDCKESSCHVPRCRDLREHLRRSQQQADTRRRAAVNEMMRQRAAEMTGNSG